MQAVKDKLNDISAMRKAKAEAKEAKAEAKAEEKAEKDLAKARMDIAREVRLAREAEAEMDLHVAKAGKLAERETAKHETHQQDSPLIAMAATNTAATDAITNTKGGHLN